MLVLGRGEGALRVSEMLGGEVADVPQAGRDHVLVVGPESQLPHRDDWLDPDARLSVVVAWDLPSATVLRLIEMNLPGPLAIGLDGLQDLTSEDRLVEDCRWLAGLETHWEDAG